MHERAFRIVSIPSLMLLLAACGQGRIQGDAGPGRDGTSNTEGGGLDVIGGGDGTGGDGAGGDGSGGDSAGTSDSGGCGLVTCASAHAGCGLLGDGCGGVIDCGGCIAPQTCGGGGVPSQCGGGTSTCVPRTCAGAGLNCGPIGDGCGGVLNCGTCTGTDTCGGGGTASVCGHPTAGSDAGVSVCVPRTCASVGVNCGPLGDGCGGLLNCGTCTAPAICGGGGVASVCGGTTGGTTCTGLCLRQVSCDSGTTTVSGTVVAPTPPAYGAPDPIYSALVYVPNGPVMPFTPGVTCDRCGTSVTGVPLVTATTGPDGRFTLSNVPTGANIPLVIQIGRWRRQVVIPNVAPCTNTALPTSLTRLPRNHTEGDIPLMAMVTGNVDTLECVLRKIGIDDSEFTTPSSTGRVQFYRANGASGGAGTPAATTLTSSATALARYDMVLFACEGMPLTKPVADQTRLINYANAGGRVFATHYSYTWLYNDVPFSSTATWRVNQTRPPDPLTGLVDTTFPRGMAFSQWLTIVGAASAPGRVQITQPRHDVDAVIPPSQRWIYSTTPSTIQHYTFNTPVGTPGPSQCGRVLFSDFHVANSGSSGGMTFPAECTTGPMTAQEKVLEFMIFDLSNCIMPDMPTGPTCTPRTCAAQGITCGPAGDGCGGTLNCGTCTLPDTCGGGGMPGVCGHRPACTPQTCASQALTCGPAGDGCGGLLNCGMCTPPDTCGGGGVPGVCGHPGCTPRTCAAAGATCGAVADGCGGVVDCGACTPPETCGGGGFANQCGVIG